MRTRTERYTVNGDPASECLRPFSDDEWIVADWHAKREPPSLVWTVSVLYTHRDSMKWVMHTDMVARLVPRNGKTLTVWPMLATTTRRSSVKPVRRDWCDWLVETVIVAAVAAMVVALAWATFGQLAK